MTEMTRADIEQVLQDYELVARQGARSEFSNADYVKRALCDMALRSTAPGMAVPENIADDACALLTLPLTDGSFRAIAVRVANWVLKTAVDQGHADQPGESG